MPSMYIYEKQKWSPVFRFIGAISNIIMNIFLIPKYGIMGAAIATTFSYFIMSIFLYYKSNQWMHIKYQWNLIIKQIALSIIVVIIFINQSQSLLTALSFTIFYVFLLMLFGFKKIVIKVYKQLI